MHIDLVSFFQGLGPLLGYITLFTIIFAESGLLIGFFLPGDSILFISGFLASQGFFSLPILLIGSFIAAVVGDNVGYAFGKQVGKKIFTREDSLLFHKDNIMRAQKYYEEHGPITVVIARFIPVIRTFAPIVAGVGDMHYRTFVMYNLIGGFLWAVGLTLAGYFLGKIIPADVMEQYLLLIVFGIIIISILPNIIHIMKDPQHRAQLWALVKKPFIKKS